MKKLEFFLWLTFLKTGILSHNHKYILSRNYFYTKVIQRAETSLYGQHNPGEKEPSLRSMFYEDSPKGNRKNWRSHPRHTKDPCEQIVVLIFCVWEFCLPCSTGILGSSAFTTCEELWTLFMKEGDYKEVLLWCCFWLFPSSAMLACCCGYWKYAILRV